MNDASSVCGSQSPVRTLKDPRKNPNCCTAIAQRVAAFYKEAQEPILDTARLVAQQAQAKHPYNVTFQLAFAKVIIEKALTKEEDQTLITEIAQRIIQRERIAVAARQLPKTVATKTALMLKEAANHQAALTNFTYELMSGLPLGAQALKAAQAGIKISRVAAEILREVSA